MKIKDDSRRQKWVKQCTVGCSQMPNSKQRAALIPPRMSFAKHILIWCSIWFEFHRFAKINWQLCTPCNLCIIYFLKLIIFILFIRLLWLWLDVFFPSFIVIIYLFFLFISVRRDFCLPVLHSLNSDWFGTNAYKTSRMIYIWIHNI